MKSDHIDALRRVEAAASTLVTLIDEGRPTEVAVEALRSRLALVPA